MSKPKVLILGGNGFIGKSLSKLLSREKYQVFVTTRASLDATNYNALKDYLEIIEPDFVINAALSGQGRLLKKDSAQDFYNNLLIQENLLHLSPFYKKLIIFGSGSEQDRSQDINNLREGEYKSPPNDYYGLAKYINSRRVIGKNNVINIRIFNVFGELERDDRFIKSSIRKSINFETQEIWGDVYFDFFYVRDLNTLIEHYIDNPPTKFVEINAVYNQKYLLTDVLRMIRSISGVNTDVIINPSGVNKNYFGSGHNLAELRLSLVGLYLGLDRVYGFLKCGI